jgi:tol-pal system protein YbgF
MKHPFRATLVAVALALGAHAAQAAIFPDDEARRRIEQTNIRLSQLQREIEDRLAVMDQQLKSGGIADLANQMQVLQSDIAKLRGQVEVITYELEQSQKRQRDLYVDLDTRMRKLETAAATAEKPAAANPANATNAEPGVPPPAAPAEAPPPAAAPPTPGASFGPPPGPVAAIPPTRNSQDGVAEQRAYDSALDFFKRGDYGGAINGFTSFLKTYPRSPLASSAQFWLGSAQYARRDYKGSIATQQKLLKDFPDSGKAPEAMLNIAAAQSDIGDSASARRTLERLIAQYPKSEAATRAKQRLGVK